MPRRARLHLPNIPLHIVQRGNNRAPCFFAEDDYRAYLQWLAQQSRCHGCAIHAYVLMSNHVHLLVSAVDHQAAGAMMKALHQRYAHYINHRHQRSGTLWENRYHASPTQEEGYLLACQRYIELNPVRAGMVGTPGEYRWSSFCGNALGATDPMLQAHSLYLALGPTPAERQAAYRHLFEQPLAGGLVGQIRGALNGDRAIGDAGFVALAAARGRTPDARK